MQGQTFPKRDTVLEACGKLMDFGAWDRTKIDPEGWLSNFSGDQSKFALFLLSRFTFLSDHLVDQLFRAAFQDLSNHFPAPWLPFESAKDRWASFYDDAIITLVQGEEPNPSDSGWLFARKARQALGIAQHNLVEPGAAISRILSGFSGPVVFVDDFVGSGEQFIETWTRDYEVSGGSASFQASSGNSMATFFYCNAMTTEYGRRRISSFAPNVHISSGNIIPERYSLAHKDSLLWPDDLRSDGISFVREVGHALGYVSEDGGENDWRGFHMLGLALAFEHSIPDANLPIFFSTNDGWKPLVQRL